MMTKKLALAMLISATSMMPSAMFAEPSVNENIALTVGHLKNTATNLSVGAQNFYEALKPIGVAVVKGTEAVTRDIEAITAHIAERPAYFGLAAGLTVYGLYKSGILTWPYRRFISRQNRDAIANQANAMLARAQGLVNQLRR